MDTNFFALAASRLAEGDIAPALLAVCAAEEARAAELFRPSDAESAAIHALAAQLAACVADHPEFCCEVTAAEGETFADVARHCRAPERLLRALNHATHDSAGRSPVGGETLRAIRGEFAVTIDPASHTLRVTHSGHCAAEFPCHVGLDFPADCQSFSVSRKRIDSVHYDPAKVTDPARDLPFSRYRLDCEGGICLHAVPAWDATLFAKSVGLSPECAAIVYAVTKTGHTVCLATHEVAQAEGGRCAEEGCSQEGCTEEGCTGECMHEECDDPNCLSSQSEAAAVATAATESEQVSLDGEVAPNEGSSECAAEQQTACDETCEPACETSVESTNCETTACESAANETMCEASGEGSSVESPAATEPCLETHEATAQAPMADEHAHSAATDCPATGEPACEELQPTAISVSTPPAGSELYGEASSEDPASQSGTPADSIDTASVKPAARRVTAWLENYLLSRAGKKEAAAATTLVAASAPAKSPEPTAAPEAAPVTAAATQAAPVASSPVATTAVSPAPAASAPTPVSREESATFWTAPNGWQVTNLVLSIAALVTLGYVVGRQTAPPQTTQAPPPPTNIQFIPAFQPGQPVLVPSGVPNTPVSPANYAEPPRANPNLNPAPAPAPEPAPRADLKMDVYVPEGQVAVGEDAIYEIHLTNRGRLAAEEIDVQAFFSEGFEPVNAEGALARINPGRVEFARIPRIVPGQEVVLKVVARSAGEGERVFRPEVKCKNPEDFLHAEVATRFFFAPGGFRR